MNAYNQRSALHLKHYTATSFSRYRCEIQIELFAHCAHFMALMQSQFNVQKKCLRMLRYLTIQSAAQKPRMSSPNQKRNTTNMVRRTLNINA